MNLLRPSVRGAAKSLLLKNSYRTASYNSAIQRGFSRDARAESTFDRGRSDREGGSRPPFSRDRDAGSSRPFNRDREGGSRPPFNKDREGGYSKPYYNREDGSSPRPFKRDYDGGSSRPPYGGDREGGFKPSYNREDGGSSRPPFKKDYEGGSSRPPFKKDYEGGSSRPPFKKDYEGGSSRPPFNRGDRDREGSSRPFNKDYFKSSYSREDEAPARTFNKDGDSSAPRTFNKDRDASSSRPSNRDSESSPRMYGRDQAPTTYRRDDRYAAPEYTRTPRRTVQKVNQESEWIYGTNVVEAALKSNRRTLYRLYIYAGENRTAITKERDIRLKNLARGLKIDVREVEDQSILDSMSDSRQHNGYVLEASKLPKIPIISLENVSFDKSTFGLQIAQHDFAESGAVLNDVPKALPNRDPTRYPLVLMLDEILDPGNLGAILRSAYFLGCSALLVTESNCAPLSPTCLKSSAGASEYMPILTHVTPPRLIEASKAAGWKFFAAAPRPAKYFTTKYVNLDHEVVREALDEGPVVLLMGGEGEGIRESIKKLCNKYISIVAAQDVDKGVDSLNVSVAAGVLMQAFLGKPAAATAKGGKKKSKVMVLEEVEDESGNVTAEEVAAAVEEEAVVDETIEEEEPTEEKEESAEAEIATEPVEEAEVDTTEPAKST